MAETAKIKTRIQLKNDTETNWSKATNFIPKKGELIIYNPANGNTGYKFKIGKDDITKINDLSFAVLDATCLPTSGVTAGSYGQASAGILNYGDSFRIPYITIDNKGRVTAASTMSITLPANENTDYRVKIDAEYPEDITDYYPTFSSALTASSTTLSVNPYFRIKNQNGTNSTIGISKIILGNNITNGSVNNSMGSISLYSSKTGVHEIFPSDTATNLSHILPTISGTLLNSGTTKFDKIVTEGTILGILKINNISTTIQAPIPSALISTYFSATGVDFNKYLNGRVTISSGSATNINGPKFLDEAMTIWNIPILQKPTNIIDGSTPWESLKQIAFHYIDGIAYRTITSREIAGQYNYSSWEYIPTSQYKNLGDSTTPIYFSNQCFEKGLSYAKAIKSITRNGTTFTYTCIDDSTGSFTQQDNNTTYTAGNGLSLSDNQFSVSYSTTISDLGTASAGTSITVARGDHTHAIPALTSCAGTLNIAKGGTGATTAAAALANLGALPLSGGILSGRLIANGKITISSNEYDWLSGMILENCCINISPRQSSSSYHPYFGVKTFNNHVVNIGGIRDNFGFYGFKSGRTANGTDWSFFFDASTGYITSTNTIEAPNFVGNASTATTLQSAKTISLIGGITGSTLFDGSANVSINTTVNNDSHTHSYSTIARGATGFWNNSVSPLDRSLINYSRACRTAFTPAEAIKVEYTTNGSTWIDYGLSDSQKEGLFSMNKNNVLLLGKNGIPTVGMGVRITIEPTDRYCSVDTFYCLFSTSGHTCECTSIERSTIGAKDTFITIRTNVPVSGWPGHNEIQFPSGTYGGSSSQTSNTYKYRFTFKITEVNSDFVNLPNITDLRLYGDNCWLAANNMMELDQLNSWDIDQNTYFPAKVSASAFVGNLSGIASKAGWLNPNNSLTYGVSGLQYFSILGTEGTTSNSNVTPTNGYYHILRMNHGDPNGYFADLATSLSTDAENIWWRKVSHGTNYGWYKILDSNNYNQYALPITGGNLNGQLTINTSIKTHSNPVAQCLVINSAAVPADIALSDANSPGIGFHITNESWGSLIFRSGIFKFCTNFTSYAPLYASEFHGNGAHLIGLSASNVTTGSLAIAYGGTGANSKSGARTNLGISSGTSLPSATNYTAGDIFILY